MIKCYKAGRKSGRLACRTMALWLALGGVVLSAAGCSGPVGEDEDVLVLIEHSEQEKTAYALTKAIVTDVARTASVRFGYTQAQTEDVMFPVSGKRVQEVFVKLGDRVEKGQLLAILEGGDREEDIRELEYQIARAEIQSRYLDINEPYEVSGRWWKYVYQSSGSESEMEKLQGDVEDIHLKYRYQREDYQDIIDMAAIRIETYRKEMEEGRIFAGMDGVIYRLGGDMNTVISDVSKPAFTIIDDSHCLFEASDVEYAEYFVDGEIYELTGRGGGSTQTYRVRPWNRGMWEDKIYLELLEDDGTESVEVGTYAYLTLVLDKRENVLAVSTSAIHAAEGKNYVYVLGENDIREVRWIETGFCGDRLTEILSGLEEGEAVIY